MPSARHSPLRLQVASRVCRSCLVISAEQPPLRCRHYTPQRQLRVGVVAKFLIYCTPSAQRPTKGWTVTLTELISSRPVAYTYYGMHGARDAGCYLAHSQWHAAPWSPETPRGPSSDGTSAAGPRLRLRITHLQTSCAHRVTVRQRQGPRSRWPGEVRG